jgi:hypothetical protein
MAYREKGDKKKERRDKEEQRKSALARYPEGEPFDQVQYLEGKLILQPDHFTSVETFRDFGGLVQRTARALGVGFLNDPNTQKRPAMREILFFDTPDIRLYKNCFILRRRTSYLDGFPVGDPEIVFKFRHPDEQKAAAVDVRPLIAGKYRIKFKAEALPVKNQVGGYRILYSHNCQFGLSQVHEADRMAMSTLVRVLPALSAIKKSAQERVSLVNKAIVEEVLLPLGKLDFGRGTVAKCDVALWRTRGEHKPLVGEFAFQVKFNQKEDFHKKARRLCEQFFITLQYDVKDWLSLDTTKTGVVYRMQYGNDLQSYE